MAPGCFSQSSKETMPLKSQAPNVASPVKPQSIRPSMPPLSPPLQRNKRASIDSFEILEQTIIKQKRLAKLKNTDLRKKVLLKKTFDLICDIMDTENGFTEDDEEPATPMPSVSTSNVVHESELELELHDNSSMDDEELAEEPAKDEEPVKSVEEEAVLPRQPKRRASEDEETFFCESHSNDQQLNWRRSHEASAASGDHHLYSDDSSSNSKFKESHRTNHQRSAKRTRTH